MARLFVAVRPPSEVLASLAALPRAPAPGVRWVPPEQWHVTLRFLADADEDRVVGALDGARAELAALPPVRAELGPRVSRLGRNVVCVPVAGLEPLAAVVIAATAAVDPDVDPRPFRGHLTLARLKGRGACGLAGHAVQGGFAVREVELVRSRLGAHGARHELVRSLPVGSPG